MKPANFAPVYACLYPGLAEIARAHGYALAAHGSLARDFDIVCIPWVERPSPPQKVVDAITKAFAIRQIGAPELRLHNRLVYTISVQFGECSLDLSFMPTVSKMEPLAWIRIYPDGKFSTDIIPDHVMEECRVQSGEWVPLTALQSAGAMSPKKDVP